MRIPAILAAAACLSWSAPLQMTPQHAGAIATLIERHVAARQSTAVSVADKIWQGGGVPTIDDPLYKSIADELRAQTDDLAGATAEGDPWEFTVPTTLVWLQPDGTLPTFA